MNIRLPSLSELPVIKLEGQDATDSEELSSEVNLQEEFDLVKMPLRHLQQLVSSSYTSTIMYLKMVKQAISCHK